MGSAASAALASWTLDWRAITVLLVVAALYLRGWLQGRRLLLDERDGPRLGCFLASLAIVFLATESPLDAFDGVFLSAHMTQHLLLMMFAPPLLLLGHPILPLLRALPKPFVKEGLGPFLAWPAMRRLLHWISAPPVTWLLFAFSTIFWHLPALYELALRSRTWHGVQHASFFWTGVLFWWPIIRPVAGKSRWPQWVAIPYLLLADIVNTALSAFFVFSGRLLYPSYAMVGPEHLSARDDQTLAGLIMWVPGSLVYLIPAFIITVKLISGAETPGLTVVKRRIRRQKSNAWLRRATQWRPAAQAVMLLVALLVMADGFLGPQITPLNLAGILPWIHWRALSVFALLAIGNLFCMACPFTFVRDLARKALPAAPWRWPRMLRTKWLAAMLFVLYLWAYEAFGLWDSPWITAWVIAAYFLTVVVVDTVFRGASFCKYVCPIGQFHFVSSLISPREVAVKSQRVCKSCRTHDCVRGNEHARGCELYLFQPKKAGNLDCTFCLDCVKACPHENLALVATAPGKTLTIDPYRSSLGRYSKRTDLAALVLLFVFGAFVNAAGMVAPVMIWEHGWHATLGAHFMPLVVAVLLAMGLLIIPGIAITLCGSLNRLVRPPGKIADLARRFIFVFVPIGFSMWAAHLAYHFVIGWDAALPPLQRLMAGGGVVTFPQPVVPGWLTPLQILFLDAGLLLTLYLAWQMAREKIKGIPRALAVMAPWGALACTLYAAGVWILLQPMQMRGMLHP